MGTKIHSKSYLPGYHSMRDPNEASNSSNCPLFFGDKTIQNGKFYHGLLLGTVTNLYSGYDKDLLKQTMLKHEAVFKHQVCELHRLYKVQKGIVTEIKRKELHKHKIPLERPLSSSPLVNQMSSDDTRRCHRTPFLMVDSTCNGPIVQFLNACSSKNGEVLYSRPSNVQKRLFDLHLPADKYIDIEEEGKPLDNNIYNISSCPPSRNDKIDSEISVKLNICGGGKVKNDGHALRSGSCLRSSVQLADLNEPIQVEDPDTTTSVDFIGYADGSGEIKDLNKTAKPQSQCFLGLSKEKLRNYQQEITNSRVQLICMNDAGHSRTHMDSVNDLHQDKLSLHSQLGYSMIHNVSTSIRAHPPLNSLDFFDRNSQLSHKSHGTFRDKWQLHSSAGSIPRIESGLSNGNGICHGPSTESKYLPAHFGLNGFDYLNSNKDNKVASECSISFGIGYLKGSNALVMKSMEHLNINTALLTHSSNEISSQQSLGTVKEERKYEDHLKVLPWPKANSCKNEEIDTWNVTSFSQIIHNIERGKGPSITQNKIFGFPIFDNPCTPKNEPPSLISTSASLCCTPKENNTREENKFGVIDINLACDFKPSTQVEAEVAEKENDKRAVNVRGQIDLNSCVSEEEITLVPTGASASVNVKIALEIDLEVPALAESEEDISLLQKAEQPHDEADMIAAKAIVAISSCLNTDHIEESTIYPSKALLEGSLLWFSEIVSSHSKNFERNFDDESRGENDGENKSSSSESDDFEAMTLKLTVLKEEDYMPKPLVSENHKMQETEATSFPSQTRNGKARRGRQRRDFQRDILPGLTSLSRHEVTEDLRTLGGLMKTTGHSWAGLSRRNGGTRSKRRFTVDAAPLLARSVICSPLMERLNNIDIGLEERILTGWAKTPRRPRRQRCHAGNLSSIGLS